MRLRKYSLAALVEALRRRQRFNQQNQSITDQWTGLGSKSEYAAVLKDGLMVYATSPNPGHMTWWKLTEKGARIVAYWLGQGWTYERIEAGEYPSAAIPAEVL